MRWHAAGNPTSAALRPSELPFDCIVAPTHPLAREATISLQQAVAHPIALQSKTLMIRRYLEAHHGWLFTDSQKVIETNSLQFVKRLARSGCYLAFIPLKSPCPIWWRRWGGDNGGTRKARFPASWRT